MEEQAALAQHVAEAGWSVVRTASGELVTQIAVSTLPASRTPKYLPVIEFSKPQQNGFIIIFLIYFLVLTEKRIRLLDPKVL